MNEDRLIKLSGFAVLIMILTTVGYMAFIWWFNKGATSTTTEIPTIESREMIVQTAYGEMHILPLCEQRTVCFVGYWGGGSSWSPMSCVSEGYGNVPLVVEQMCG